MKTAPIQHKQENRKHLESVFIKLAISYGMKEDTAKKQASFINDIQTFLKVITK